MFFRTKTKRKTYVEFVSDGIPFELERAKSEPAVLQEMRVRTEAAWQNAIDEINRDKKARLLEEYRACLRLYRTQLLICMG